MSIPPVKEIDKHKNLPEKVSALEQQVQKLTKLIFDQQMQNDSLQEKIKELLSRKITYNSVEFTDGQEFIMKLKTAGLSEERAKELWKIANEKSITGLNIRNMLLTIGSPEDFQETYNFKYFVSDFDFSNLYKINNCCVHARSAKNFHLADYLQNFIDVKIRSTTNERLTKETLKYLLPEINISVLKIDEIWDFTNTIDETLPKFPVIIGAFGRYSNHLNARQFYGHIEDPLDFAMIGAVLNHNIDFCWDIISNFSTFARKFFYLSIQYGSVKIMQTVFYEENFFNSIDDSYSRRTITKRLIKPYLKNRVEKKQIYFTYLCEILKKKGVDENRSHIVLECFFNNEEKFSELSPSFIFDPIAIIAAFGNLNDLDSLIKQKTIDIESISSTPVISCYNYLHTAILFENIEMLNALKKRNVDFNKPINDISFFIEDDEEDDCSLEWGLEEDDCSLEWGLEELNAFSFAIKRDKKAVINWMKENGYDESKAKQLLQENDSHSHWRS